MKKNFMHWRNQFVPICSFHYLESWSIYFQFSFFSSIKVVELDKTVLLLLKHDNENLVNEVSIKIHPFFGGISIQWEKIIYLPSIDVEKKSTFNF